ncbi:MAG: hypothetical protein RQ729_03170 [Wenzhouxiangellaceae bacterium]|nr:hypothetical protein [Wenzhouxiangellaceae bacterium]
MSEATSSSDDRTDNRSDDRTDNRKLDPQPDTAAAEAVAGASGPTEPAAGNDEHATDATVGAAQAVAATSRSGRGVAWLALLLALAALAAATRSLWLPLVGVETMSAPRPASAAGLEAVQQTVSRLERDLQQGLQAMQSMQEAAAEQGAQARAGTGERLQELRAELTAIAARLGALEQARNVEGGALRERLESMETELGQRLEAFALKLEGFDAGLDESARSLTTRLRLVDADRLLAAAQDAVAFGVHDRSGALAAWQRARQRLALLEGPQFETVRALAAAEQSELQAWAPVGFAADLARLQELARDAAGWSVASGQPAGESAADNSGWRARLGELIGGLVQVENTSEAFVNPAVVDAERRQLVAELDAAALALARADVETVVVLADRAADRIEGLWGDGPDAARAAATWLRELESGRWNRPGPAVPRTRAEIARLLETLP